MTCHLIAPETEAGPRHGGLLVLTIMTLTSLSLVPSYFRKVDERHCVRLAGGQIVGAAADLKHLSNFLWRAMYRLSDRET